MNQRLHPPPSGMRARQPLRAPGARAPPPPQPRPHSGTPHLGVFVAAHHLALRAVASANQKPPRGPHVPNQLCGRSYLRREPSAATAAPTSAVATVTTSTIAIRGVIVLIFIVVVFFVVDAATVLVVCTTASFGRRRRRRAHCTPRLPRILLQHFNGTCGVEEHGIEQQRKHAGFCTRSPVP